MHNSTLQLVGEFAGDENASAMEAAVLISRCLDEALDPSVIDARLRELAARYQSDGAPWLFLGREGFGGAEQLDVTDGSRIDAVLETRKGLPITLGTLLVYLSESTGREAVGINFPGRFLVRVEHTLVDPFSMSARTEQECLGMLPKGVSADRAFAVADANTIVLRMFNNLKYHYAGRAEFHRALDMLDCQLKVVPDNSALYFEQGEFWLRLGSVQGARHAFQQAERLAGSGEAEIASMAGKRLEELTHRSDTLH